MTVIHGARWSAVPSVSATLTDHAARRTTHDNASRQDMQALPVDRPDRKERCAPPAAAVTHRLTERWRVPVLFPERPEGHRKHAMSRSNTTSMSSLQSPVHGFDSHRRLSAPDLVNDQLLTSPTLKDARRARRSSARPIRSGRRVRGWRQTRSPRNLSPPSRCTSRGRGRRGRSGA
jgi:hypothetical protein